MSEAFDPYYKWLGIPSAEQPPNHYRLLGLTLFESDADVIANAADQRMAHVRTFQAGRHSDLSQRVLNEIATARVCLLNAERKAEYDRALQQSSAWGPRPDAPADDTPVSPSMPPPPLSSFNLPPPMPLAPAPTPPSLESLMVSGPPPCVPPPPPCVPPPLRVAWVEDVVSQPPPRSNKAAWHGVALFLGVLTVAGFGLWTAWQGSAPESRARLGLEHQAAVPGSPHRSAPAASPDKSDDKSASPQASPKKAGKTPANPSGPDKPAGPGLPAASGAKPRQPDAEPAPPKLMSQTPAPSPSPAPPVAAKLQKVAEPTVAAQKAAETKLAALLSGSAVSALRAAAQDAQRDAAERFVLLTKAIDSAAAAGDLGAAMELIDEKARQFEIEATAEKARTLTAMRARANAPEAFSALAEQMLLIVEQPASPLPRGPLGRLAETTIGVARRSGDVALIKRATLRFLKLRDAAREEESDKGKKSSSQP